MWHSNKTSVALHIFMPCS